MARVILTEKYRPKTFEDFIGSAETINKLKAICRRKYGPPNAILLIGPRGCGKTTLAHIIRRELKVEDKGWDFQELNAASTRGIDTIRDIHRECMLGSFGNGYYRIYFFDECHQITKDAQNAMLKLLENPPKDIVFILATTDPQMLIATVRSRCTTYGVSLLTPKQIRGLITNVLEKEKITDFPQEAIKEISDICEGSAREALVLLDSVIDIDDDDKLLKAIKGYSVSHTNVKDLCQALLVKKQWKDVAYILKGIDDEPESVRYAVLSYMSTVVLNSDVPQAVNIITNFCESLMYSKKAGLVRACYYSVM